MKRKRLAEFTEEWSNHQSYPKDVYWMLQRRSNLLTLWNVEKDTTSKSSTPEEKYRQGKLKEKKTITMSPAWPSVESLWLERYSCVTVSDIHWFWSFLSKRKMFVFFNILVCACVWYTCACFKNHKKATDPLVLGLQVGCWNPNSGPQKTSLHRYSAGPWTSFYCH